jgi:hypothetical protein
VRIGKFALRFRAPRWSANCIAPDQAWVPAEKRGNQAKSIHLHLRGSPEKEKGSVNGALMKTLLMPYIFIGL